MLATSDIAFAAPDAAASMKFTCVLLYHKKQEDFAWTEVSCVGRSAHLRYFKKATVTPN